MPWKIGRRERAWDDAAGLHKMGWVNEGDVVEVGETYLKSGVEWARFELLEGAGEVALAADDPGRYIRGTELLQPHDGYDQYWVVVSALGESLPEPGSDGEGEIEFGLEDLDIGDVTDFDAALAVLTLLKWFRSQ